MREIYIKESQVRFRNYDDNNKTGTYLEAKWLLSITLSKLCYEIWRSLKWIPNSRRMQGHHYDQWLTRLNGLENWRRKILR